MDEQGSHGKTEMEEESLWNIEKLSGHQREIQEHCQGTQGCNKEGYYPLKSGEQQQERLLYVCQ